MAALPRPVPLDATLPWRRNSQPFDQTDTRPRIAVVLTGLGLASTLTEAAIKELPPGITLSFTPYSRKLNQWVALARVNGHEVLLDLPMEPTTYPDDDPGPQALLTALSSRQNLARLDWTLGRTTGYVGVAATMGSRFAASEEHMTPILLALKDRGLLFLDNRASDDSVGARLASEIGVPHAVNDRPLDWAQASRVAIDARLIQLENMARSEGFAVAMGRPYPVTIERLRDWAKGLEARGLVLAPISAIANRQPLRRTARREAPTE
ncbi:MAG: divergent polysaccharide deacetylase family protein [Proteobacteria bacterium]|nr:divergent polysaccharide deacetylase family protein [Pseudomonadota bacterium]